jgi:protein-S-isoprenylcysteine O-methyltransferase Ste14
MTPDEGIPLGLHVVRQHLFRYRSYTPIPFLVAMVIFAQPTYRTMLLGGIVAALGEFMRFWGVSYAGSLTRVTEGVGAPEVVVAGPFAHVRNPLYIGNILMYTGIGLMSNALFPWLLLSVVLYFGFQYTQIVLLEEEFLTREFGAAYLEFQRNVPRFLPRMKGYTHFAQEHQVPRWREALKSETRTLQAFGLVILLLIALWLRN